MHAKSICQTPLAPSLLHGCEHEPPTAFESLGLRYVPPTLPPTTGSLRGQGLDCLVQGAAEKKWTPKFFCRFLSNRLGF